MSFTELILFRKSLVSLTTNELQPCARYFKKELEDKIKKCLNIEQKHSFSFDDDEDFKFYDSE